MGEAAFISGTKNICINPVACATTTGAPAKQESFPQGWKKASRHLHLRTARTFRTGAVDIH